VSGLHVIPRAESRNICLVAVTFQGLRIYLTDGRGSAYSSSGLRVAHLRFPPPETETANLGELVASSYINGSLLCAYGSDAAPDSNPIVGATVDLGKLVKVQAGVAAAPNAGMAAPGQAMGIYNPYPAPRPPLSEYSYAFNVPGRIWTVRNLPKASSAGANTSGSIWTSAPNAPTSLNMLATQFTEPPDQFVVFTNTALTFVVRKRTTDVLRAILESDVGGPMGGPPTPGGVATFIEAYVFYCFGIC
jgi:nuclear pore complex protein Nup155